MKKLFWALMGLCALSGPVLAKEAGSFAYISHTGNSFIVFDPAMNHFSYQGSADPKKGSDLGGEYSDCSENGFLCVWRGDGAIAVPLTGDLPTEWNFKGSHFSLLQTLSGGEHKVWLISATAKGDTYMHFSYSRERGIETLSEQVIDQPKDLARTYFLMNKRGLLASSQ